MDAIRILVVVAVVQAGLAAATWWPRTPEAPANTEVFAAELADVSQITIETSGENASTVTLAREGSGWQVASADNYGANTEPVETLIAKLRALRFRGEPVATQATSHGPLGVADETYSRRVEVVAGGEATTLFIGSGAGSSVHVRRAGQNEVWRASGATLSDFAASAGSYVDTQWHSLTQDDVASFTIENVEGRVDLQRLGDTWQMAQLAADRVLKTSEIERVLRQVAAITMVEPTAAANAAFTVPTTRVSYTLNDGTTGSFEIGDESGSSRFARRSGDSVVVRVTNFATAALREASATTLSEALPPPAVVNPDPGPPGTQAP